MDGEEWSDWSETDLLKIENLYELQNSHAKGEPTNTTSDSTCEHGESSPQHFDQPSNATSSTSNKLSSQQDESSNHSDQSEGGQSRQDEQRPDNCGNETNHHQSSAQITNQDEPRPKNKTGQPQIYTSDESSTDDTPLIKLTKNRQRLKKQDALRKSALKRLSNAKRFVNKIPVPKLARKKLYCFRKIRKLITHTPMPSSDTSISDESGDEYKPNRKEVNSSDSEISDPESTTNIKLIKLNRKHRDKNRKRKGKCMKTNAEKKRRVIHATDSMNAKKQHRSGPWKLKENEQHKATASSKITQSEAISLSRKAETNRRIVLNYHTLRLDNLLLSNGLKRISIQADGNCFLSAVLRNIYEGGNDLNVHVLRQKLVDHMRGEKDYYMKFLSFVNERTVEEKDKNFENLLQDFSMDGHWNMELADFMHLALAVVKHISIDEHFPIGLRLN